MHEIDRALSLLTWSGLAGLSALSADPVKLGILHSLSGI